MGVVNAFTQDFADATILELEEDETIKFNCTLCHQLRQETRKQIVLHVCECTDPDRDWHFVPNCIAIICVGCQQDLCEKLFSSDAWGCINCRRKTFSDLEGKRIVLQGVN